MATIPQYQPSEQVSTPDVPQIQIQPVTPAAAPTNIGEAQAALGKQVEGFGSELLKRQLMMERLEAQRQGYQATSDYRNNTLKPFMEQILSRRGTDAVGSEQAVRDFINGKAAVAPGYTTAPGQNKLSLPSQPTPGRSAIPAASEQYAKNLGALARNHFDRITDTYNSSAISAAHSHEQAEYASALEAQTNEMLDGQTKLGDTINTPEDMQQRQASLGQIFDNNEFYKLQFRNNPAGLAQARQSFIDIQANNAIDSKAPQSWEQAKKLLAVADVSPQTKDRLQAKIMGAEIHQTAEGLYQHVIGNPAFQLRDGSLDMEKIRSKVYAQGGLPNSSDFNPEQKDQLYKMIKSKEDDRLNQLHESNEAGNKSFMDFAADPKNSAAQAESVASQYAAKLPNGQMDHEDLRKKIEAVNIIHQPLKGNTDPETYVSLLRSVDNGAITNIGPINEAFKGGTISKGNYTSLAKMLVEGRSQALNQQRNELIKNLPDVMPDQTDRTQFIASLRDQEREQGITKPDDLVTLWNKNTATVKTGASRLFGLLPDKTDEYWRVVKAGEQIKDVGNPDKRVAMIQRLGGPDNFQPGSPQSTAVNTLTKRGWKPDQITSDRLKDFLKDYPDGK